MIIEAYTDKYKQDIVSLLNNFYDESLNEYDHAGINKAAVDKVIEAHKDGAFLMIVDDTCQGLIAGMTVESPLTGTKAYQELIWYVNIDHRLHGVMFLARVEKILKNLGYKQIVMACMENSNKDKLFRFYERMGFKPIETHFLKEL